jgi:hypothetical protein
MSKKRVTISALLSGGITTTFLVVADLISATTPREAETAIEGGVFAIVVLIVILIACHLWVFRSIYSSSLASLKGLEELIDDPGYKPVKVRVK